jgi:hypothetical protein
MRDREGVIRHRTDPSMTRFALMLAALVLAVVPALLGVLENDLFRPESPSHVSEQTSDPTAPQLQRPDPAVDDRISGNEHSNSPRSERLQAHN